MRLNVKVTGTRELHAKLRLLDHIVVASALGNATMAGALVIEGAAKQRAPKRSGTLSRSIHSVLEESSSTRAVAQIGTDVEYAPYVEYGTRYMRAQPYLRPALDAHGKEAQAVIERAFKVLIMSAAH